MLRHGISSLLLLGALLIGIFYLKPAWDQFQQIRTETDRVRQLSAEFDDLIQNRDALVAKLNLVSKDDLNRLEALIPQGPQSLEYLLGLQQLAQENGVALTFTHAEINPTPTSGAASTPQAVATIPSASRQPQMLNPSQASQPKTTINDLPVGIQIVGSYEQLKTFIGHIEHFGRLTDISTLAFTPSQPPFTFSVSLITHYQ